MKKLKKFFIIFIALLRISYAANEIDSKEFWKNIRDDNSNNYPVIFIHGIVGNFDDWNKTAEIVSGSGNYYEMRYIDDEKVFHNYFLEEEEYQTWNISYYSMDPLQEFFMGSIERYAKRVEYMIDQIRLFSGEEKVVIVAHSMGGIVARKYMINSKENWDSVHKILTVGTPNRGTEDANIGIIKQVRNLGSHSDFILNLNSKWEKYEYKEKWGVVGGIVTFVWPDYKTNPKATDNPTLNYIAQSSAIPYGEWKEATNNMGTAAYDTPNFGYRIMVNDTHVNMVNNMGTLKGILWAIK